MRSRDRVENGPFKGDQAKDFKEEPQFLGSPSWRHSITESPRSMEEDNPPPRSNMLVLGGIRDMRSSSMRFSEPPGHDDGAPPLLPRRSTRSTASPPYAPKISEYGFVILSSEEGERLKNLKGRLRANTDFDDDALQTLGFYHDIYVLLENLEWRQFSDGVLVHLYGEIALEILMTMKIARRMIIQKCLVLILD